jgi:peptide chain release factor 3
MRRKALHHVTSNWMDIEKQGGISITPSVIQFEHKDCILYLFDTPCHEFFSEDAYGTPAAVDTALMVN